MTSVKTWPSHLGDPGWKDRTKILEGASELEQRGRMFWLREGETGRGRSLIAGFKKISHEEQNQRREGGLGLAEGTRSQASCQGLMDTALLSEWQWAAVGV